MNLPMPEGVSSDAKVHMQWTLCYTSKIDPTDAADYTRSGLEVTLRPHFRRRALFDTQTKQHIQQVDIELDESVIAELSKTRAVKWSDAPIAASSWRKRHEGDLRNAGKWETLSRGEVWLAGDDLYRPRIDLNHLARSRGVLEDARVDPLPVALIVSIRVPGLLTFYDEARAQYPVLVPLEQLVQVPIRVSA